MFDALIDNIGREILTLKTNHRKSLVNIKLTKKTFRIRLGEGYTKIYVHPKVRALTTLNLSKYSESVYDEILHLHWYIRQANPGDDEIIYWVAHGDIGTGEVDATITCTSNFDYRITYGE